MQERHRGTAAGEDRAAVAGAEAARVAGRTAVEATRVDGHRKRIGVVAEAPGAGGQTDSPEHRRVRGQRELMAARRLCERRRRHLDLYEHQRVELTGREWEVVDLLRKGLSTRAIADLLGISAVTVRRHISAVHGKLGVQSRAELLQLLAMNGNEVAR